MRSALLMPAAWCQNRSTNISPPSRCSICIISDAQKSVPPYIPGDLSIASVSANVCADVSYSPASAETSELKVENGVPLNGAPGTPAAAMERNRIHTAKPVTTGSLSGEWNCSCGLQNQKLRPNS